MKRTTMIVLAVATALSMTACDALDAILQVNIFSPFAAVSVSEIKSADAATLIELAGSDSFFETLADDPDTKLDVLATIDEAMAATPTSSSTYQELAVLAAAIELQTTPAGELVNNISEIFTDLAEGTVGDDIGAIITGIMPDSVLGADGVLGAEDKTAFVAMIDALEAANDYYMLLGAAIPDGYADGTDVSAGDVAQSALVSAIVGGIEVPVAFTGTTGEYLYSLLTDPDNTPETTFVMPAMDSGPLGNILLAADLNFGSTP